MKYKLTALGLFLCASLCNAQGLSLKEYQLGASMAACPPGTLSHKVEGPALNCKLGPTTFANQAVKEVEATIFEAKLSSVMFVLAASGPDANSKVLDALKEKYGAPSMGSPESNKFSWFKGDQVISFDGWKGHVLLADLDAEKRELTVKAKK
jgi:hypothetical protein